MKGALKSMKAMGKNVNRQPLSLHSGNYQTKGD
jgi:hypothetical protein